MDSLINGLRVFLASNFVIYSKTHSAHWNVTGMFFYELHKMFEDQYNDLWQQVDTIAEKLRQLDSPATISPQDQITLSVISADQPVLNGAGYVKSLLQDHNRMIILLNKVFKLAESENNQAIMNYVADRLDAHAKHRWFLKSTLDRFS